jgi:hypothetical protein
MTSRPWASAPAWLTFLLLVACHKPVTPAQGTAATEAAEATAATALGSGPDSASHYTTAEYMTMHPISKSQPIFQASNLATFNPAALAAAKPAIPAAAATKP